MLKTKPLEDATIKGNRWVNKSKQKLSKAGRRKVFNRLKKARKATDRALIELMNSN